MSTTHHTLALHISPEVAAVLGSQRAIDAVRDGAEGGYVCTVCDHLARLTDTDPAAVLVLARPDGPHTVRLAHRACADSAIIAITDDPHRQPALLFPAMTWLRPADTDPAPVLVIAPRVHGTPVAPGEVTDSLTTELLHFGFRRFTHPQAPITDLDAVTAYLWRDGTLNLLDAGDEQLWSGVIDPPAGWTDTAHTTARIGVVFATGLVLDDPNRDRLTDLAAAIDNGRAVAATVTIDNV